MYNGVYSKEQFAYVHDSLIKWLKIKLENGSLGKTFFDKNIECVAVYGVNEFGRMVCSDIKNDIHVEAFIDRKAPELGLVDGLQVLAPEEVNKLSQDCCIVVTPEYYFREIADNLMDKGVREDRIVSIAMVVS